MTKTRFLVFLTVLALLASVPLTSVLAQAPRPAQFYGMVMVDGEEAPEGTMVTAMIGEGEDEMKFETMTDAMGGYALRIEGDFAGQDIMFMIGERMGMAEKMDSDGMMMMEDSVMFMEGSSGMLNLSAGQAPPTRPTTGTGGVIGPRGPAGEDGEAVPPALVAPAAPRVPPAQPVLTAQTAPTAPQALVAPPAQPAPTAATAMTAPPALVAPLAQPAQPVPPAQTARLAQPAQTAVTAAAESSPSSP